MVHTGDMYRMIYGGGRRTRTRMARWPPDFKSGSLPIRIALRGKQSIVKRQ
jgi:hypothetical protein